MIRVRIAPSPTGYLHVGTARTALFNYLFARKEGGIFILRIEDTDIKRSSQEMVDVILDSLKWLGLEWDEGPYFQSERFDIYRKYAEKLVSEGKAYYCYCTPEEIKERKEKVQNQGKVWKYDRRCLHLTDEEKKRFEGEGRSKAIRFLVPDGKTDFDDLIHGKIERENQDIEDFVLIKSDGTPGYNFSVVIDDHEMGITHVIRGDDHISNTPKQILVYRALGWDEPAFAHVPLILGQDRSKLSKRHGAVAVSYYRDEGILPEAFVNFLALLGWSPGEDREIFSMDELIKVFSLDRVGKKPAIFDINKLLWMNQEYIRKLDNEELVERIVPYLKRSGLIGDEFDKDYLLKVVHLMKERLQTLRDLEKIGYYYFKDDFDYDPKGLKKRIYPGVEKRLEMVIEELEKIDEWDEKACEDVVRRIAEEEGCKAGEIIHPIRLGISGMTFGPGLFELMELLGKARVINRLKRFVEFLRKREEDH